MSGPPAGANPLLLGVAGEQTYGKNLPPSGSDGGRFFRTFDSGAKPDGGGFFSVRLTRGQTQNKFLQTGGQVEFQSLIQGRPK